MEITGRSDAQAAAAAAAVAADYTRVCVYVRFPFECGQVRLHVEGP